MKNLSKVSLLILVVFLTSCTRGCESFNRNFQMSKKDCHVIQYSSDGHILNDYKFHGIVNNSEHSDGVYFTIGDSTIELSGSLKVSYNN